MADIKTLNDSDIINLSYHNSAEKRGIRWEYFKVFLQNYFGLPTDVATELDSKLSKLDTSNASGGGVSATSNNTSGRISFSTVLEASSTATYTINNSLVTASTPVDVTLNYINTGAGEPTILSIDSISTAGAIKIKIKNLIATPTDASLVVDFQLLDA